MTGNPARVLPIISAVMLTFLLSACALSDRRDAGEAIQNGVIVDDLRQPSRQNF